MRRKLSSFATILLFTSLVAVFLSCEEDEADWGKQAAIDYCDCIKKGNSKETCDEALFSEYGKSAGVDYRFRDAFNKQGKACGASVDWDRSF